MRGLQTHSQPVTEASAGQRTAVNLQGVERAAVERGDVVGLAGTLVPSVLVDGTLELLGRRAAAAEDARPRPLSRRHQRDHGARAAARSLRSSPPGQSAFARFRLEAPLVALPGDRFVIRSYSPMVTIGGGTLLDIAPPRFKRKAPAPLAHLTLLARGTPGDRRRGARPPRRRRRGAGGRRCPVGCRSAPSGCAALLDALQCGRPGRGDRP